MNSTEQVIKGLPANVEAERSILGAILLDNKAFDQCAIKVAPDDFSLDSHRRIFIRMSTMMACSRGVDLVTLSEDLMHKNELEAVGGASYISGLTDNLPRLSNIEHYLKIVKDKANLRRIINIGNSMAARCTEGGEEAGEILAEAEAQLFAIHEQEVRGGLISFDTAYRTRCVSLDELHDRESRIPGLATGFRQFDDMTGGLRRADLIVVGARPSVGKTSFATDLIRWAGVKLEEPVAAFSLEMSTEALVIRILCAEADVDSHKLQTGFASREDWKKLALALSKLAASRIFIDDSSAIGLSEMRAKARQMKREHGLGLIVVDYLQLMSGGTRDGRTQEVSMISRGLKALAKDLDVPVVALSQLNRRPETRSGAGSRPTLADLRESGAIEQDADVVVLLYREEMSNPTDANRGLAEAIIAKQRNGPIGTVSLVYIPQFTSFRNAPEVFESDEDSRQRNWIND